VKMRLQWIEVVGGDRKRVCGEDGARQGMIHLDGTAGRKPLSFGYAADRLNKAFAGASVYQLKSCKQK
jgi:hypothetical protein